MSQPASLEEPTVIAPPSPVGLSSGEAARRLLEFGPNAVVEERVRPLARVVRHLWAPVPWMLEATIAVRVVREVGADQIVMGTHGLGSLGNLFLGSIATQVVRLSQVPVTLVK